MKHNSHASAIIIIGGLKKGGIKVLYREYRLIKELVKTNSLLNIEQIANVLNSSTRIAYMTISGINDWLTKHNLSVVQNVRGYGYYIQPEDFSNITKHLKFEVLHSIDVPKESRVIIVEFALLYSPYPVPLQYLKSLTNVTQRTIQKDLAEVKDGLGEYGLKLYSNDKHYFIYGDEENIRKFGLRRFRDMQDTIAQDKVSTLIPSYEQQCIKIERGLLNLEQQTGHYLTDESLFQVKQFICFSLIRYKNKFYLNKENIDDEKNKKPRNELLKQLLQELGVSQSQIISESNLLSKVIESRQASQPLAVKGSNELYLIAGQIIRNFYAVSGIKLDVRDLQKHLYTHLIAAERRVRYNIQFLNFDAFNVKRKYPEIYLMTKQSVKVFEDYLNKQLTSAEIELIAVYFGGELEKTNIPDSFSYNHPSQRKVLLVCGNGMGTSRLLQIRLNKLFPNELDIKILTKQEYEDKKEVDSDLVIATLPVLKKGPPVINIHADLSSYDIREIKKYLPVFSNDGIELTSPYVKATQVLDIVSQYARIENFPGLTSALQSYFLEPLEGKKSIEALLNLSELLPIKRIVFKTGLYSWKQAVQLGGSLLERDHITDASYTQQMQKQIESYGPYMSISEDMMLLHAKPGKSQIYSVPGMSLIRFRHPIEFDKNTNISYVFSLYSPDFDLHLNALTQLTEILSNNKLLSQFKSAQSPEEIARVIKTIYR